MFTGKLDISIARVLNVLQQLKLLNSHSETSVSEKASEQNVQAFRQLQVQSHVLISVCD